MSTTTTAKRSVGRPPRLTPAEQQEVFRLRNEERVKFAELAKRYNVGIGTIDRALRKVTATRNQLNEEKGNDC